MNKAVIVVGSHEAGKSRTINKHFKPMIGLSGNQRNFPRDNVHGRVLSQSLEEREGVVLSQSLEEKGLESVKDFIKRYADLKYLVCAARPDGETLSFYLVLKAELESIGYCVSTVNVEADRPYNFYHNKAKKIYNHLFD